MVLSLALSLRIVSKTLIFRQSFLENINYTKIFFWQPFPHVKTCKAFILLGSRQINCVFMCVAGVTSLQVQQAGMITHCCELSVLIKKGHSKGWLRQKRCEVQTRSADCYMAETKSSICCGLRPGCY